MTYNNLKKTKGNDFTNKELTNDSNNSISSKLPSPNSGTFESPVIYKQTNQRTFETDEKRYATPVKIQNIVKNEDGFETPVFIHKNDIKTETTSVTNHNNGSISLQVSSMKNSLKNDVESFVSQLDNARDKQEKIKICINILLIRSK